MCLICWKQKHIRTYSSFPRNSLFRCTASVLSSDEGQPWGFRVTLAVSRLWLSGCGLCAPPDAVPEEQFLVCITVGVREFWDPDGFFSRPLLPSVEVEIKSLGLDRVHLLPCCAPDSVTDSLLHTWPKTTVSQGAFKIFFESKEEQSNTLLIS